VIIVTHLPGVEAMMAKDEASHGLGIEVIAEFRGRSHELGRAS
jgi:hypothetical protein